MGLDFDRQEYKNQVWDLVSQATLQKLSLGWGYSIILVLSGFISQARLILKSISVVVTGEYPTVLISKAKKTPTGYFPT